MVDRIRWDTVSYLPFYYVFFQFLLLTIFNLQANILTTKDILSNLGPTGYWVLCQAGRHRLWISVLGLFLGLKLKISPEQNVINFQFYIRLSDFSRLLGSIMKIKVLGNFAV